MSETKPYPTPLEYHPDDGWGQSEIRHDGVVVALVPGVDDFPCLGNHGADGGAIQQEIDATGRKLVRAYNCHDDLINACKAIVAGWGHQDGVSRAVQLAREAITKAKEV